MASSIGTAWIQIKPSLKGISKEIESELGGQLSNGLNGNAAIQKFAANGITALRNLGKFGFTALAAVAAGAIAVIGSRINSAVNRIDTLLNFPRVLQAMGVASDKARAATTRLSEKLQGLPTALQDGAAGVQRFVSAGLGVGKSTDLFIAMNNALIAAGAGADDVQIAMEGMQRAISSGEVPTSTLQAMLSRMPTVMAALQKSTGKSQDELQKLFSKNPQALIDNLIKLNKDGGGGMKSLETQARRATGGISTAWTNLGNAIDRGWVALVTALGGGDLETGAQRVSDFVTGVGKGIENVMKSIGDWINNNGPLIQNVLLPALAGIATAIGLITAGFILMALFNPVNLIIAGMVLLGAVIGIVVANWDTITKTVGDFFISLGAWFAEAWNGILAFFTNIGIWAITTWEKIKAAFGTVGVWFGGVFANAWQGIKNIFGAVGGFFRGVWNTIVSIFGKIGSGIGNAIGGAFKTVVNSVIGFAEKTINGFIKAINAAIDLINKIPGIEIGKLQLLSIPRLATGGPVFGAGSATSDSVPAMLSNGEYVIKAAAAREIGYSNLDRLNSRGELSGNITMGDIIIQGYNKDPKELAQEISKIIAFNQARVMG